MANRSTERRIGYLSHVQQLEERVLAVRPRFPEVDLANIVGNLFSAPGHSFSVALHGQLFETTQEANIKTRSGTKVVDT